MLPYLVPDRGKLRPTRGEHGPGSHGNQTTTMCGIAGYSLGPYSDLDRTLAARALLTGIADRGADAVGYAYRGRGTVVTAHKQQSGASGLFDDIRIPRCAVQLLLHVRDCTSGDPSINANNHPIRHGSVVGVHNGVIANADDLFAAHRIQRFDPRATVDSEVIFALAEHGDSVPRMLEDLHGAAATAWLDERRPETLYCALGISRPLWIGRARNEFFFASTRGALRVLECTLRRRLRKAEVQTGTVLEIERGRVVRTQSFRPDRDFDERNRRRPVQTPWERVACMKRLSALAAA
jgi:glutamine phosphoribosylpyrophosphate amidotransferase